MIAIIFGLYYAIAFVLDNNTTTRINHHTTPDSYFDDYSAIGNYIGGISGSLFSLASAILVVATLYRQERKYARDHFIHIYYEMLHIHNSNVSQLILEGDEQMPCISGRHVFSILLAQYHRLYDIIHAYTDNILKNQSQKNKNTQVIEYLEDEKKRAILEMRLCYGYFFYGSESYSLHYDIDQQRKDKQTEQQIEKGVKQLFIDNNCRFAPYNVTLGHYYRHMYQMIQLLINTDCLNENDKYAFAKQLRAQLDDDEQLLLYYNAMSDIGSAWLKANSKRKNSIESMCPMSRFRMIKNIPFNRGNKGNKYDKGIRGISPENQFKIDIDYFKKKGKYFFEHRD